MKKVRISVEWSYSEVVKNWTLSDRKKAFLLGDDPDHVGEQIRVMHLLQNCIACWRGTTASSRNAFDCDTPCIEDYLQVVQDPPANLNLSQFQDRLEP